MLRIIHPADSNEWNQIVHKFDSQVLWKQDYLSLYSDMGSPELACFQSDKGTVLYPYLKRSINLLFPSSQLVGPYYDITSPYGYGGPLVKCSEDHHERDLLNEFYEHFNRYCAEENIITEFIRFHPLLHKQEIYGQFMEVESKTPNIYVDLCEFEDEQELLRSYKYNNRKSIAKAKQNNVTVIADESGSRFDDFYQIYVHTMNRNEANDFYYFSEEYFSAIHTMKGNFVYFHSIYDNRIVSTELLLYDRDCIYSFLGGTLSDYYHVCPNNALKHEVILWARNRGIKTFVLGGGYRRDDGIYNYKKSFAPLNEVDFCVGKKVHNKVMYEALCEIRRESAAEMNEYYFPLYRS